METGIIGIPLSGKTTLFNSLTGLNAQTSAYTGGKREVNVADVDVPDERLDGLFDLFKRKKKVNASVRFKDMHVEFTPQGGVSPACIAEMRHSDAITIVLRAFEDESVAHPKDRVDPLSDLRFLLDALIFSDYAIAVNRMDRLTKEGRKIDREYQLLDKLSGHLEEGKLIGKDTLSEDHLKLFSGFSFLTAKPIIVVANTGETTVDLTPLEEETKTLDVELFEVRGDMEMEIAQLPPEDQREFLQDLGLEEPAKNRFLKHIYSSLKLITFLTVGTNEVRAWSIPEGTSAVKAAGRIHTDMERGFIRAEAILWEDLVRLGGFNEAKTAGKLRLEGKDYIVEDGEVLTIRFNV
jgi:GTP-binding protein YchF